MPCAIYNCQSGYATSTEKVRLLSFPKGETRQKWIEAVNRVNFTVTKDSYICEKHFKETDWVPTEKNVTTRGKPKAKKTLKEHAVPSLYLKGGAPEKSKNSPTKTKHDHQYSLASASEKKRSKIEKSKPPPTYEGNEIPVSSTTEVESGKTFCQTS